MCTNGVNTCLLYTSNPASVLPVDPQWGASVLPADMDNDEDDVYAQLVH